MTTAVNSIGGRIDPGHMVATEPATVQVRIEFGGEAIADSSRALVLHEDSHDDVYYFPQEDVRMDLLHAISGSTHCPYKGDASYWTVDAGGRQLHGGAWGYLEPLAERPEIEGMIAFYQVHVDAVYVDGQRVK